MSNINIFHGLLKIVVSLILFNKTRIEHEFTLEMNVFRFMNYIQPHDLAFVNKDEFKITKNK